MNKFMLIPLVLLVGCSDDLDSKAKSLEAGSFMLKDSFVCRSNYDEEAVYLGKAFFTDNINVTYGSKTVKVVKNSENNFLDKLSWFGGFDKVETYGSSYKVESRQNFVNNESTLRVIINHIAYRCS